MEQIQKIVATGCLIHDNKVLVVKRAEHERFLPGYYELPGGKLDFGETPVEALVREFKEETGLEIEVLKPYDTFAYVSDDQTRHTAEILFLAKLAGQLGAITLDKGHSDFRWFAESEIDNQKITPEIKSAIHKGFVENK